MKLNKMIKGLHWIVNHLLFISLIVFIVLMMFLFVLDNLYFNIDLNKIVNDNAPTINLIIGVSSIVGVVTLYGDYLAQKQHEAVFGFYANIRIFLKRLNVFLGENFSQSSIFVILYTVDALKENSTCRPTEEHINAFRNLCIEFISFLSNSKDNIPIGKGDRAFSDWYEKQIDIVELLQKGTFFTVNYYGEFTTKNELERFYNKIKNNVRNIDEIIKKKIEEDGLL